jgi:hypothetical protein
VVSPFSINVPVNSCQVPVTGSEDFFVEQDAENSIIIIVKNTAIDFIWMVL